MNTYNAILDWEDVSNDSVIAEPVTVQEAKDWMRLEGFIDELDSTPSDFDDDDAFIEVLITSARMALEKYTGLSFTARDWEVELTNLAGDIDLPWGPVNSIEAVEDTTGNELQYTTTNNLRKLKTPKQENIIVKYNGGYTTTPAWAKAAILNEVAFRYINRGDENVGLSSSSRSIVSPFKQGWTWLA